MPVRKEKFIDFAKYIRGLDDAALRKARASIRKRYYPTTMQDPDTEEKKTIFLDFAIAFDVVNLEIAIRDFDEEEKISGLRKSLKGNIDYINQLNDCGGVTSEHLQILTTPVPKRKKKAKK